MASPLLSNTASNEARKHWLLEQRLTAPLDKDALAAVCDEGEVRTLSPSSRQSLTPKQAFGVFANPAKRLRLGHEPGAEEPAAGGWAEAAAPAAPDLSQLPPAWKTTGRGAHSRPSGRSPAPAFPSASLRESAAAPAIHPASTTVAVQSVATHGLVQASFVMM